jgi:hypothetical protein
MPPDPPPLNPKSFGAQVTRESAGELTDEAGAPRNRLPGAGSKPPSAAVVPATCVFIMGTVFTVGRAPMIESFGGYRSWGHIALDPLETVQASETE